MVKKGLIGLIGLIIGGLILLTWLDGQETKKDLQADKHALEEDLMALSRRVDHLEDQLMTLSEQNGQLMADLKEPDQDLMDLKEQVKSHLKDHKEFDHRRDLNTQAIINLRDDLNYAFGPRGDERREVLHATLADHEVYLKPQTIHYYDDYTLNGVSPFISELTDNGVYEYYFDSSLALQEGLGQIGDLFLPHLIYETFIVDETILLVYVYHLDTSYEDDLSNLIEGVDQLEVHFKNKE